MPHFVDSSSKGFTAAVAIAMGQIVKMSAANTVTPATAATDKVIGVALEACAAGRTVNIKLSNGSGTLPVLLGGTVALGDKLVSNGSGAGITGTQAGAGVVPTSNVVAIAVEAGVSGQIIEAMAADMIY
jgi:hypothetical protein